MLTDQYRARLNQIGPLTYQLALRGEILKRTPDVVVETGVYNGVSTVAILDALNANERGTLYSCDPRYNHRGAAEDALTRAHQRKLDFDRWRFDGCRSRHFLPAVPAPWDVFCHDSDHSAENMTYELEYAWDRIRPGGLLVCDDYLWPTHAPHHAFRDFCRRHDIAGYETHATAAFVVKP